MSTMNIEQIKEQMYDETAHLVRDINASAEKRIAEVELDVDNRIADALHELVEEGHLWEKTGEGDSILATEGLFSLKKSRAQSIFEEYPSTINGSDVAVTEVTKKKYKNLSEAEWTNTGLSPYQDPNNVQTIERLRLQQTASLFQYINYPIARSEIENFARYTLGRGLKVDCLAEPVMKIVRNFWRENKMERRLKRMVRTFLLDGEYFPLFFTVNHTEFNIEYDTPVIIRSIPSAEIDEIELDLDDRETPLAYRRLLLKEDSTETNEIIYLDASHPFGDEKEKDLPSTFNGSLSQHVSVARDPETTRVMFFKYGLEYDVRGRVLLEPVLRWNRVAVDFLYSRSRLNHLRSKIFLIEERTGGTGKRRRSSIATQKMPQGGMVLTETPDLKYRIVAPNTGADDAETDYKMLLYMIGSALSMPIHILNMNAENENYASIKEAANPFAQAILDFQDEWGENIRDMLRYIIKVAIREGYLDNEYEVEYLPEDIIGEAYRLSQQRIEEGVPLDKVICEIRNMVEAEKEKVVMKTVNIPLTVTFPLLIQSDPQKESVAIKSYIEMGLMSKYTASLRIGLDPDVEKSRMSLEWEDDLVKKEQVLQRFNTGAPDADVNAAPEDQK